MSEHIVITLHHRHRSKLDHWTVFHWRSCCVTRRESLVRLHALTVRGPADRGCRLFHSFSTVELNAQLVQIPKSCWKLDSLRWFSQRRSRTEVLCARCIQCDVLSDCIALFTFCVICCDSAKHCILRVVHPGGDNDPQIRTQQRFLCNAPTSTPKFYHLVFTCSEVILLTHKHTHKLTPPKTSSVLRYATTCGNHGEAMENK